jgi:polysaccharide export outer membrane protein
MKRRILISLVLWVMAGQCVTAFAAGDAYRLGPGDILEISVWKDESLSREVIVPPDSIVSFPLIGDIQVKDLTVAGLREIVAKRLNDFVPNATVTVMLRRVNSLTAYVIGKVNKPGQFPIDLETRVMQILAMAGGLNPFASPGNILILRQEDQKTVKILFNYKEMEKGENLGQNIVLKRGDVVVVP